MLEVLNPTVPGLDVFRGSVTYAAIRGWQIGYRSIPELAAVLPDMRRPERSGPSWSWAVAQPQQGIYWRLRERIFHTFARNVFQSQRPVDYWRQRRK